MSIILSYFKFNSGYEPRVRFNTPRKVTDPDCLGQSKHLRLCFKKLSYNEWRALPIVQLHVR